MTVVTNFWQFFACKNMQHNTNNRLAERAGGGMVGLKEKGWAFSGEVVGRDRGGAEMCSANLRA